MTEPSKWATEAASQVFICVLDRDTRRNIAIVLDAALRRALEEAANIAHDYCWMPAVGSRMQNDAAQIEDRIRALIDREPTP